jgi:hypothetical protein
VSSILQLRNLIAYVVCKLVDMEASFGKTKLVKLLYLIDVENYRLFSHTLTGLDWVFYHYGPYAFEVDQTLKELDLDIPQEEVLTGAGHKATVFRPSWDADAEFESQASSVEKLMVDRVIAEWGLEELNPILSHVYFHTEPMKDARRGEVLDFAKIQKLPSLRIASRPSAVVSTREEELREKFQRVRVERWQQVHQRLDPEPRLDDTFWRAITHLDSEEQYSVPRGDIELMEEFKGQLRDQAELE